LTNREKFRSNHSYARERTPLCELPGSLSQEMRKAKEAGYTQGQRTREDFKKRYFQISLFIAVFQELFPSCSSDLQPILCASFFHGFILALEEMDVAERTVFYGSNVGKIGSMMLMHLAESYRGLAGSLSRYFSREMYPGEKRDEQRSWEIYCQGALGVALFIQSLRRYDTEVYHPTPFEDIAWKIDLFALDPSGEFGFCFQVKTRKNRDVSVEIAIPDLHNDLHLPFLLGVMEFATHYPEIQWIPLFVTVSIPNLTADPQSCYEGIDAVVQNMFQHYKEI